MNCPTNNPEIKAVHTEENNMQNSKDNEINFSLKISWAQKNKNFLAFYLTLGFFGFLVHSTLVVLGMLFLQEPPRDLEQSQTAPQEQVTTQITPASQTQCGATVPKQTEKSHKKIRADVCN